MTQDESLRVASAYLDQFIARGAASDVRDLRRRLGGDADTRVRFLARLPSDTPDALEVFDAFHEFVGEEWRRAGSPMDTLPGGPDLRSLASRTAWGFIDEQGELQGWKDEDGNIVETMDPAMWYEWLDCVEETLGPDAPLPWVRAHPVAQHLDSADPTAIGGPLRRFRVRLRRRSASAPSPQ